MNIPTEALRAHIAAHIFSDLAMRQGGNTYPIDVMASMAIKAADEFISRSIGLDERRNVHQAILALEQDIDHSLNEIATDPDPSRRHYWRQREMSCQDAIVILKRMNLPNPPSA
jgi:hypothetical protein